MAQDINGCGSLENAYGPYDYNDAEHKRDNLPVVEAFHFTPSVENLTAGRSDTVIGDLDYTLRAFPNHHRALYAMARYQLEHPVMLGSRYRTIDCYFDRAMRWRPQDGNVRMIYGIYLRKKGDMDGALRRYKQALVLEPDSAEVHYNLGLLYLDIDQIELARQHAEKAYALGYPLQGLRNQLFRRGAWRDGTGGSPGPAASTPAVPGPSP